MYKSAFIAEKDGEPELKQKLDALEIQLYRMQENVKAIAKKSSIISINQTKDENWVIVYANWQADSFQIMLHECTKPYRGKWDSAIEAEYKSETTIHINNIKGIENKGFGSVLMEHLKEIARDENKQYITGDIVERDFDHVRRLEYFYTKHYFDVKIDHWEQCGEIIWQQSQ
ncbi:hypothetical protein JNUCC74_03200 [Cerasibacillus sp. JNUCC 74]